MVALTPGSVGRLRGQGVLGLLDTLSCLALLVGSAPVIAALRTRRLHLPERLHARIYLALLVVTTAAGVCA